MKQLTEFFAGLFDTDRWPPRWHCGFWSDFHGWLYIISDLFIWLAYFLIPVIIVNYFIKKKDTIKFRPIYLLFAAFILLCGMTHFLDATMFWIPMYRLNALIRFITAIISMLTAFFLVKTLPAAFRQKTSVELEREISRREEAELSLARANRDLEAFAYIASHDLQAPLRKIMMYSSMLFDRNEMQFDDKSKELSSKVLSSAKRLTTLTEAVLQLSVLKGDVLVQPVSLRAAVDLALSDLEIAIREKGAIIKVADDLPTVKGNVGYLSQLFLNLISNALKFCTDIPVITITTSQNNTHFLIIVRDNGIGMPEAGRAKIFNAFSRLHPGDGYQGSGIGLAICKRIVEIHQGRISVESSPGKGSTFTIELPLTNI
jgi:two-component system, chemotaxis family, sensor kinase Cph1